MHEHDRGRETLPYDWRRVSSTSASGRRRPHATRVPHRRRRGMPADVSLIDLWGRSVATLRGGVAVSSRWLRKLPRPRGSVRLTDVFRRSWFKLAGLSIVCAFLVFLVANNLLTGGMPPAQSASIGFSFQEPVVAWSAPNGDVFGAVHAGVAYQPVARYGDGWVQVKVVEHGQFWVRAAELPGANLSLLSDLRPAVGGYGAYTVAPGDSIQRIATLGGSDAALIQSYNHLDAHLPSGRPLIVPRLEHMSSLLPPTPLLVTRGNTDQPYVALTIDLETGDAAVQRMLDSLQERNVQITFFVLGRWVEQHPELARRIVADGHELANHSLSHADFVTLPDDQIAHELAETERLVQELTGGTTRPYFRAPYGSYNDRVLLQVIEQGYLPIHWSVDSGDAAGQEKTLEYVLEQVTDSPDPADLHGAIILSHCCIRTTTVDALPAMLDRFAEMGIEVRTLTEVLGR